MRTLYTQKANTKKLAKNRTKELSLADQRYIINMENENKMQINEILCVHFEQSIL